VAFFDRSLETTSFQLVFLVAFMSYKEPHELLTIQQACRLINVHPNTLRNWERKGDISALRIGHRHDRRYRMTELLGLLSSNNGDSSPFTAAPGQSNTSDFSHPEPELVLALIARYCISLSQAAQLTGYHEDYLGQAARFGKLKAIKVGRNWITLRSSIVKFCRTHPGAYAHRRTKMKTAMRPAMSSSP
jgi:excisionase family DNA binding protein